MQIEELFTKASDGNIAYHVTNDYKSVDANRSALAKRYGFDIENMHYMEQTHGANVEIITEDSPLLIKDCDALITNLPNKALMVMVADCIPILLKDEKKGVIAVIHAGRNSTFLKIASETVKIMVETLGCEPSNIQATLGPSIQKCCYEVNEELANIVKKSFGEDFLHNRYIDLQGINVKLLKEQGVKNIKVSPVCTRCSNQDYFSYRLDNKCGRFAGISVINL